MIAVHTTTRTAVCPAWCAGINDDHDTGDASIVHRSAVREVAGFEVYLIGTTDARGEVCEGPVLSLDGAGADLTNLDAFELAAALQATARLSAVAS